MDISKTFEFMKTHGFDVSEIKKLQMAADMLPNTNISLRMPGLNSQSSLILMSRLLRRIARALDIEYSHPDAISIANLPVKEVPLSPSPEFLSTTDEVKEEYNE